MSSSWPAAPSTSPSGPVCAWDAETLPREGIKALFDWVKANIHMFQVP